MFRRFRTDRTPTREQGWQAFALRLELIPAPERAGKLRELLGLEADTPVAPIYRLERTGDARITLFDYLEQRRGPAGEHAATVTVCLLDATGISPLSVRATRKLAPVLESIGASAVGGEAVTLPGAPGFSERVTLYARDPEAAEGLITPPVREVLERALCSRVAVPTVQISERHLLLTCKGTSPLDFEELEYLLSDVLSLYAALRAARR